MAHTQKPDFVFRRNGRVHLNRRGSQFSRLLAAEVCASAVVMLDAPCSEVVWRVLATHSIRQFPLHFPLQWVTVCRHISTGVYHLQILGAKTATSRSSTLRTQKPGTSVQCIWADTRVCMQTKRILAIWRPGDRASWQILTIKPTRCTNLSNLFLE